MSNETSKQRRVPVQLFITDEAKPGRVQIVAVPEQGVEVVLFDIDARLLNYDPFVCMAIDFDDRTKPQPEPEVKKLRQG